MTRNNSNTQITKSIAVLGGANIDITATAFGPFHGGDSNPGKIAFSYGGVARNIAHNLALLGHKVDFCCMFSRDAFGTSLATSCRELGMDLGLCGLSPFGRSSCFVALNGAEGELQGAVSDMEICSEMTPGWLSERIDRLATHEMLVFDTNIPLDSLEYLLASCKGPAMIADAVSGAKSMRLSAALRHTGIRLQSIKCNRMEAFLLSGKDSLSEAAGFLRNNWADRVYITTGAEGVFVDDGSTATMLHALPAHKRNATGCGDAFVAGLVHAHPSSIQTAALYGLAAAAIALESDDAVNPAMTAELLASRLR